MTNKIDHQLSRIRSDSHTGIMTHVVVGYPTLDATEEIVRTMAAAGVDLVEMQIPFSDPLADGPTIQAACEAALTSGTRVRDAFVLAKRLQDIDIPLLFMAYFNTLYKYGVERFCQDAAAAGISGLIVPDAPFEAAIHEGFLDSCHKTDLYNIITLSPTSTPERLRKNAAIAQGFVYCVARQGVTGAGGQIYKDVASYLHNIREHIDLPLALGFGISDRVRFEAVAPYCDIAVVGSAIIDIIASSDQSEMAMNVDQFIRSITKKPKAIALPSNSSH